MMNDVRSFLSQVSDCLWGRGSMPSGPVTITYKRLEKGTFVRFQPLARGFHEAAGEDIREVCWQTEEEFRLRSWPGGFLEGDVATLPFPLLEYWMIDGQGDVDADYS